MDNVRPSRIGDAEELAPRLRAADLREISAASGQPPLDVLRLGAAISRPSFTAVDDWGNVIGMFGAVPTEEEGVGAVWMLASETMVQKPYAARFLRLSRQWVASLQDTYPILWNMVDARNKVHIRWIKWCGFTVDPVALVREESGLPFYSFTRTRNV